MRFSLIAGIATSPKLSWHRSQQVLHELYGLFPAFTPGPKEIGSCAEEGSDRERLKTNPEASEKYEEH
jgi:hypothetical protein